MKNNNTAFHLLTLLVGSLLGGIAGLPVAHAYDDTEVYIAATSDPSIQPNIMFIVDTSGSMDSDVTVTTPYDPGTTYTGSYNNGRVYWSTSSTPPSTSTSQWFATTNNMCKASLTPLSTVGQYTDQATMWRSQGSTSRWRALASGNNLVECQDDSGIHGSADGVLYADKNATNSATKWTGTVANNYAYSTVYNFWSGNYLNWVAAGSGVTTMTRLEVVQDVAGKIVDSLNGVNIGLMRFSTDADGGMVAMPIGDIATNRSTFKTTINAYTPSGGTPLSEVLYEAYLYYTGGTWRYGNDSTPFVSVASSRLASPNTRYQTPVTNACQKNYIIYLTDGDPTSDVHANDVIRALPNVVQTYPTGGGCPTTASGTNGQCLDDLAGYMNNDLDISATLAGQQNVQTYTIGFFNSNVLLDQTGSKGGGDYYTVDTYEGVLTSLKAIFVEILQKNGLFTAPAVSVNAFNRLEHSDRLYFALFGPQEYVTWPGNIKRYRYDSSFNNGDGTYGAIVDNLGLAAIDPATGNFKTSARSFWNNAPEVTDGDEVPLGGVANEMPVARTAYTYTGSAAPSNVSLTATAHALTDTNAAITKTMLGNAGMSDADRTTYLRWAMGQDVEDRDGDANITETRQQMSDPLHSQPQLISYGGTVASPDLTLYALSNEGRLHAFNSSSGVEIFSFMPQELLTNIPAVLENATGLTHIYGLDGPLVAKVRNTNVDLLPSEGDYAHLYFGMRRGGRNYYSMDVTTRSSPVLRWQIIPGASGNFSEMGQSWSAPRVTKIKIGSTDTDVIIFGGGYDTNNDVKTTRANDGVGRAIYIANANTGALLYAGGTADTTPASPETFTETFADMHYSIPSDIKVLDMNTDGLADQIYVGDMGGQVWRFDINNGQTGANLVSGGVIADLGGTTAANNRHFYYAPDVALTRDSNNQIYLSVALGSGWREHPLDTVIDDRFYVIKQGNINSAPISYTKLTEADLYDATLNTIGEGTAADKTTAVTALQGSAGWYIRLEIDGEKVLAGAIIFDNNIIFTSFSPASLGTTCGGTTGTGRVYLVSLLDAQPTLNLNGAGEECTAGTCVQNDRSQTLDRGGIPPSAILYFPPGGGSVVGFVGGQKVTPPGDNLINRTFWREEPNGN